MNLDKTIKYVHLTILGLFLIDLVLWLGYDMSFNGYYFDRILFWGWLVTAVFFIIRCKAKYYGYLLIAIVVLSMIPMMLPFLKIVSMAGFSDRTHTFEINEALRVDIHQSMGPPKISFIEKGRIFEEEVFESYTDGLEILLDHIENKEKITKIALIEQTSDSVVLRFVTPSTQQAYAFKKKN